MRVAYSVVCESARMRADGRVDIEGIFNELQAPGFPAEQDHLVLVATVEWDSREEGNIEFEVELRGPGDVGLLKARAETEVVPAADSPVIPQTRLILPLDEVVFPQNGLFRFYLVRGDDSVALAEFHVLKASGSDPGSLT